MKDIEKIIKLIGMIYISIAVSYFTGYFIIAPILFNILK